MASGSRFTSYAQNHEDVMLWRALSGAVDGPGFYVDVGAADPTALSVTRAFYERGWRGVNVEPLPEQAAALRAARPRDVVVEAMLAARPGGRQRFFRVKSMRQTGLSTSDAAGAEAHRAAGAEVEALEVPVRSLADVCREHVSGPVHFLKIDVEGAEAAVLAGADFSAVRPWIVVVEATAPLDPALAETSWERPLLEARYRHVWFDGLNRFYLAEEHAELARHFELPPNVFDHFEVYDAPLQEHLASLTEFADRRGDLIESLETRVAGLEAELTAARKEAVAAAAVVADERTPVEGGPERIAGPQASTGSGTGAGMGAGMGAGAGEQPGAAAPRPVSGKMRLVLLLWRPFRPFIRPLLWRARTFLIGPVLDELTQHRIRLDQLVQRPVHVPGTLDPALMSAIERALLTLTLESGRREWDPLLGPVLADKKLAELEGGEAGAPRAAAVAPCRETGATNDLPSGAAGS